ncbi:DUF5610 domain-containing protein [uncultured Pseudoteredinibacter sp.]|uniref:DUF5610 domain-containing protein n=1 Tax=uncultured Pseudoteredinibacter sp. TaxID=1641701 RepID=UPI00261B21B6|nr:DUF5610 domain-containing protein [uncultured Pseudoteredinibacter sp.]
MIAQYLQTQSSFAQQSSSYYGAATGESAAKQTALPSKHSGLEKQVTISSSEQSSSVVQLKIQSFSEEQSFALFERRLAVSQELSFGSSPGQSAAGLEKSGNANSADAVAGSILGFISARLEADKANGASSEQLQSRLEAGLKGFERGFGEAKEMLKELDLLGPRVEKDISNTRDLVYQGIHQLASDYGVESPISSDENKTDSSSIGSPAKGLDETVIEARLPNIVEQPLAAPSQLSTPSGNYQSYQLDYSRERSFQMEVQTRDGDTISIDAASLIRYQESQQNAQNAGSDFSSLSFSASEDYAAAIQISGDIDEGEWQAFTELFDQVLELADNFYQGDVATAFEQALNLGYNGEEIAQFSVNLQQTTSVQQAAVYQSIEPSSWQSQATPLSDLQNYAEQLLASTEQLALKGFDLELLPDVLQSTQLESSEQHKAFLEAIFAR